MVQLTRNQRQGKIYWKNKETGKTGHGIAFISFKIAKEHINANNKNFPQCLHWFIPK